ncbi:autotransporter outer membrane beta-barrel domain-containing protein, partial [Escherichia coli]|uniref:autotransporter outer membrane beta-barrel domain-containing protein n=1 Tax=Escherichia coli TaxID=562 RepID=UPI00374CE0E5
KNGSVKVTRTDLHRCYSPISFTVIRNMSMGTAAAGSNMTFSPSRNGTSLDLQAGLEARVRENITLGVQAGYAHSVSGSSAEGYNGQATLNVTF